MRRSNWGLLGMAGAVLCLHIITASASAQWTEAQKLTAGDGVGNDRFGAGVSLQGTTAVVGAHFKNSNTGAAYVFINDGATWSQSQKLTAAAGEANDYFGARVALNGNYLVAGATGDDDAGADAGAVYVFEKSAETWSQSAKLTTTNISKGIGSSLDMHGTTVAVGAMLSNKVAIFDYNGSNWSETATFTGPTGSAYFGYSLDLSTSGTRLIVGDRRYTGTLTRQGAAYVYDYDGSTWSLSAMLLAADAVAGDELGRGVSVDGNLVAAGAGVANAVYLFECGHTDWSMGDFNNDGVVDDADATLMATNWEKTKSDLFNPYPGDANKDGTVDEIDAQTLADNWLSTGEGHWAEVAKITADDSVAGDYFGEQVSLKGDTLQVGAYGGNGAVYTFRNVDGDWTQIAKTTAGDGASGDAFGASLAWEGDTMIVGAYGDDDLGGNSGSAYAFTWTAAAAVPEPSLPVLLCGALALIMLRRRIG